jgi:hypothetical protein
MFEKLKNFLKVFTCEETRAIAEALFTQFQVYGLDWLGFGESESF